MDAPAQEKGAAPNYAAMIVLACGITLLILGISATESFSSDISRLFTNAPTDKAVWLLLTGFAATAAGMAMSLRSWTRTV